MCGERGSGQWLRHDLPRGHTVFEGLLFGSGCVLLKFKGLGKGEKKLLNSSFSFSEMVLGSSSLFLRWSCVVQAGPEFIR